MAKKGRMSPEEKLRMLIAKANKGTKEKPSHIESELQRSCKKWFDLQYPKLSNLLFAVPNGGRRNAREAGIMKAEGVTAGVADMLLLTPRCGYGCLCIELKKKGEYQTERQKEWQALSEANGNRYIVVKSIDQFVKEIKKYLNE